MPFLTCWLAGAILMVVHIIASYGVVHGWSHAAAIEATRLESFKVTGINAGWGVYVNFAFAVSWLGYSIFELMGKRLRLSLEVALLTFQILIIFSATIVFETGLIRWLAVVAFLGVTIQWLYVRSNSIQKRSSDG